MILIIIIVIVIAIFSFKPQQKTQGEIHQVKCQLPNIYLQSRNMGGLLRTMNLAFDDASILQYFAYENGVVTLTMKNGATLKAPLENMEVSYSSYISSIKMDISAYNRTLNVIQFDNFNKPEWEVIIRVMALAGKTYGTSFIIGNISNTQYNIQQILNELRHI